MDWNHIALDITHLVKEDWFESKLIQIKIPLMNQRNQFQVFSLHQYPIQQIFQVALIPSLLNRVETMQDRGIDGLTMENHLMGRYLAASNHLLFIE